MGILSVQNSMTNLWQKLVNQTWLDTVVENIFYTVVIAFVSYLIIKVATRMVRGVLISRRGKGAENGSLAVLLVNLIKYGTYFVAIISCLENIWSIKASAILATAGIASVAVGFGAQSFVQDVITGFFILLENYYSVGDLITLEGNLGTVEYLGLRSTKIRTFSGDLYSIPNGQVRTVLNHARGDRSLYLDIPVPYSTTLEQVTLLLTPAFATAAQKIDGLSGVPEVMGISKLGESNMNIKISARCGEGRQYAVERALLGLIKETFDRGGVESPYPRVMLIAPHEEP